MEPATTEIQELTFGQKAVGLTFNPSGDPTVNQVKQACAELINLVNDRPAGSYLANTFKGASIRAIIEAQMMIVKFITWRD